MHTFVSHLLGIGAKLVFNTDAARQDHPLVSLVFLFLQPYRMIAEGNGVESPDSGEF